MGNTIQEAHADDWPMGSNQSCSASHPSSLLHMSRWASTTISNTKQPRENSRHILLLKARFPGDSPDLPSRSMPAADP